MGIKKTPGEALSCVCLAPRQLVWRERTFDELVSGIIHDFSLRALLRRRRRRARREEILDGASASLSNCGSDGINPSGAGVNVSLLDTHNAG